MEHKRPHSSDPSFLSQESPIKRQNIFKTPPHPPQTPPKTARITLPPETPTVAARYGITAMDASSLVERIDTFATLIKCVAHVVVNCGGSYDEDRKLGSYIIDAVNTVTVCRLRVVLITRERQKPDLYRL